MPIIDFYVPRDKFEPHDNHQLAFPCSACKNRHCAQHEEPCRTCDHNASAVPDLTEQGRPA